MALTPGLIELGNACVIAELQPQAQLFGLSHAVRTIQIRIGSDGLQPSAEFRRPNRGIVKHVRWPWNQGEIEQRRGR